MTHKTLLAKINKQLKELEPHLEVAPEWLALRAVVKLHKPDLSTYEDGSGCECGNEYPCSTIQAIEKELC